MGICIELEDIDVILPAKTIPGLLKGIERLSQKNLGWVDLSYIDQESLASNEGIIEAFSEMRYEAEFAENGDIHIVEFTGEKFGSDKVIWKELAPFVKADSHMDWVTESHDSYTYNFDGEKMVMS